MIFSVRHQRLLGGFLSAGLLTAVLGYMTSTGALANTAQVRGPDRQLSVTISKGPGASSPEQPRVVPLRHQQPSRSAITQGPTQTTTPTAHAPKVAVSTNQPGLAASNVTPSDSTGAIGPNHYIEAVNSQLGLFNRNLNQLASADLGAFIGLIPGNFPTDPEIQWDQQGGRWLYAALEFSTTPPLTTTLDFGWSKSGDPPALTLNNIDWCNFHISTGALIHDFPRLGHDANFLLIGTNAFDAAGTFQTAAVSAIVKPAAGDSTCTAPSAFQFGSATAPLVYPGTTTRLFTPVPANVADNSSTAYIVSVNPVSTSSVGVLHVSPVGIGSCTAPPCLVGDGNITINTWAAAPTTGAGVWTIAQPGTANTLDALDGRLTQAVQLADPMASGAAAVWTQHTTGVSSAPDARTFVTWYELLPGLCGAGTCPAGAKRQEGVVGDSSLSVFNAAISPDSRGRNAVINFNTGSGTSLVSIAAQGRLESDPLNTMTGTLTLGSSVVTDSDFSCAPPFGPPCRWGDYPGASPDPVATDAVWGTNMLNGSVKPGGAPSWLTRNFMIRPWQSIGGQLAPATGPDAASWGPSRLDVFGMGGVTGDLQHAFSNGAGFSSWESLGGVLTSAPGAVSWGFNRIDVFVSGSDHQMWHRWWDGAQWLGWEPLGGVLNSAPDAAAWAPNRLDLFVQGTDRQLWHKWWDGTQWLGWEPLGGVLTSAAGAVSWAQNRLDVFVRGTDNQLWHKWWDGTQWNGWEPLGGVLTSGPDAASCGVGQLDVVVRGTDGALYRKSFTGTWSDWGRIGGPIGTGDPSAVCSGGLGLNVFTQGNDNAVWWTAMT